MIRLDYRDARPIYEQVRDGLRSMMVTGVLAAGDKLPSSGPIPSWRRRDMFTPCRAGAPSSPRARSKTASGAER